MPEMDREQHIATEDLSAFVDGQVSDPDEQTRIEQHLVGCASCREEAEELRAISQLLADLPAPEVPRSFRLSPEDIPTTGAPERIAPEPTPIQPWIVRHQATFRYAAMAAALLLALIVTVDLLPESGGDEAADSDRPVTMMDDADQGSAPADDSDAAMDDEAADESAPRDEPIQDTDESLEQGESAPASGTEQEMADDAVTSEDDGDVSEPESATEPDEDAAMSSEDAEESEDDVRTFGEESGDEAAEESADAPETERAEDSSVMSSAPEQEDPQALDESTTEEEASGGVSTLRLVALGLGVVAVLLGIVGFVIPRLWRSSASNQ